MKSRCGFALFLVVPGLLLAASPTSNAPDPRLGNWVEEKVSESYPHAVGLRVSVTELGGGLIRYRLGPSQVDAQCDGGKYPFVLGNGKPDGRTLSCRVTGPRSVESIGTLPNPDPAATFTLVETVSDDGNSLTGIATYRDANGKFVREVRRHFQRRP